MQLNGNFGEISGTVEILKINLLGSQKLCSVYLSDPSIIYHNVVSLHFVFDLYISRCHFI